MLIQKLIEEKLESTLSPIHLNIRNESHLHQHSSAGAETHFRIEVVSTVFENKRHLERHRLINQILIDELQRIKAFSLYPLTPQEWEVQKSNMTKSPTCAGG